MFPKVAQVIPTKNYTVYVYFEDGNIVCYDATHLLDKEVFSSLKDIDKFINTCTVMNDTLAWDINDNRNEYDCLDIDPDTLYALPYTQEVLA